MISYLPGDACAITEIGITCICRVGIISTAWYIILLQIGQYPQSYESPKPIIVKMTLLTHVMGIRWWRWIPITNCQFRGLIVSLWLSWVSGGTKIRVAGKLRRHDSHMWKLQWLKHKLCVTMSEPRFEITRTDFVATVMDTLSKRTNICSINWLALGSYTLSYQVTICLFMHIIWVISSCILKTVL